MPPSTSSRLAYIDWMRGLACVVMFQTHCYDAWLGGAARNSSFFMWSQVGGTLPAPLFLFLAGISCALAVDKSCRKNLPPHQTASTIIRRGAEVLAFAFLFRLQEYLIAWGWAPWTDLLRVDVLNTIGLSIVLVGVLCGIILWLRPGNARFALGAAAAGIALAISLLTPPLWTSWRLRWLPWPIESYIDGVHNLNQPQAALFPIFPWTGFAFVGLAVGLFLLSDWARERQASTFALAGAGGIGLIYFSRWLDAQPRQLYAIYDYWHTSPSFFLLRVGLLLIVLGAVYAWCRWGAGQWGFSPPVQLGQTSLLVYWVHLEFVYGRFSILHRHGENIRTASFGLAVITIAMLALSIMRTRMKNRGPATLAWLRSFAQAG